MIRLLALALLGCLATEAAAGDRVTIRDSRGMRVGDIEQSYTGRLILRDRKGRRVGTIEQRHGGQRVRRDRRGKKVKDNLLDR